MSETTDFDFTVDIGPLWNLRHGTEVKIPMYSYERPANMLWNAITATLHERGWSESRIADWLRSREPRWALDDDLGSAIMEIGRSYAKKIA